MTEIVCYIYILHLFSVWRTANNNSERHATDRQTDRNWPLFPDVSLYEGWGIIIIQTSVRHTLLTITTESETTMTEKPRIKQKQITNVVSVRE